MEYGAIKKINWVYLLVYILAPMAVNTLITGIGLILDPTGKVMAIASMVLMIASLAWWFMGGQYLFKKQRNKFEAQLDQSGFIRNHTFYGRGCTVTVDVNAGQIGLLFFWNPFKPYVLPASRLEKAWVDDGRHGSGIFEGSSQVSFVMLIDAIKIRVYTFTTNRVKSMNSDYIKTGISKAEKVVQAIEAAKAMSK